MLKNFSPRRRREKTRRFAGISLRFSAQTAPFRLGYRRIYHGDSPEFAPAYCNRGVAYAEIGKYDLASKDDTKALELAPDLNDEIYRSRALAYFYKDDGENAYRDTVTYLKRNGLKGDTAPYGLFKPDVWSTQILNYFDGQMSAEELFALANDNDTQTEAHATSVKYFCPKIKERKPSSILTA